MKEVTITEYYPMTDVKGHCVEFELGKLRAVLYNYPDMENIKARGDYYIFKGDIQIERGTSFDKNVYYNICEKMKAINTALELNV